MRSKRVTKLVNQLGVKIMLDTVVILFVTVCLGGGDDASCEEMGVSVWRGAHAMELCRQEMEQEILYTIQAGNVQTWQCVDVTSDEDFYQVEGEEE